MLSTKIECKNPSHCSNSAFLASLESRESELEIHGKMDNFGQIHGNLQSNLDDISVADVWTRIESFIRYYFKYYNRY